MLDLKSGYTAFSVPDSSTYQFRVCHSESRTRQPPSSTQEVLNGFIHRFVKVYLNDILIYSNSLEEHLVHVELVLERLQRHRLYVSVEKCRIAVTLLEYLGYEVDQQGNRQQRKHLK